MLMKMYAVHVDPSNSNVLSWGQDRISDCVIQNASRLSGFQNFWNLKDSGSNAKNLMSPFDT